MMSSFLTHGVEVAWSLNWTQPPPQNSSWIGGRC